MPTRVKHSHNYESHTQTWNTLTHTHMAHTHSLSPIWFVYVSFSLPARAICNCIFICFVPRLPLPAERVFNVSLAWLDFVAHSLPCSLSPSLFLLFLAPSLGSSGLCLDFSCFFMWQGINFKCPVEATKCSAAAFACQMKGNVCDCPCVCATIKANQQTANRNKNQREREREMEQAMLTATVFSSQANCKIHFYCNLCRKLTSNRNNNNKRTTIKWSSQEHMPLSLYTAPSLPSLW